MSDSPCKLGFQSNAEGPHDIEIRSTALCDRDSTRVSAVLRKEEQMGDGEEGFPPKIPDLLAALRPVWGNDTNLLNQLNGSPAGTCKKAIQYLTNSNPSAYRNPLSDACGEQIGRISPFVFWQLENHPEDQDNLSLCANLLFFLYLRNDRPEDLNHAIEIQETATMLPSNDNGINVLSRLALLRLAKCSATHSPIDINQAIRCAEEVLAISKSTSSENDIGRATRTLAKALHVSYLQSNNPEHLDRAIQLWLEIDDGLTGLDRLASLYLSRFRRTKVGEDLALAKLYIEKAVKGTSIIDSNYGRRCITLAAVLSTTCARSRNRTIGSFDNIITLLKDVTETNLSENDRRICYRQLGSVYGRKAAITRDPADIDHGIYYLELCVKELSPKDRNSTLYLRDMGDLYMNRYDYMEKVSNDDGDGGGDQGPHCSFYLEKAIEFFRRALGTEPTTRPDLLMSMARAIFSRTVNDIQTSSEEIIDISNRVVHSSFAPPGWRILAWNQMATVYATLGDWHNAARCSSETLDLLPLLSPRSSRRDDRQYLLSEFSGLVADAATFAILAKNSAYEALRRLEQGRGMIMNATIDLRSDISLLKDKHPTIHKVFNDIRNEIDEKSRQLEDPSAEDLSGGSEPMESTTQKKENHERLKNLSERLEGMIAEIRYLDGFKSFLLPPSEEEMKNLAEDGAIVVINTTTWRSDAFIVTKASIRQLELPNLKFVDVKNNVNEMDTIFRESNNNTRHGVTNDGSREIRSDNTRLCELLLWLWEAAVNPVCQKLKLKPPKKNSVPRKRIWWIGVGPLSRAPFHAAGNYMPPSDSKSPAKTENAVSLVKSSYIPTIKILSYARRDTGPMIGKVKLYAYLFSMPKTPGHPPLSSAGEEIEFIRSDIDRKQGSFESVHTIHPDSPSKQEFLRQFNAAASSDQNSQDVLRIVHFTCHGIYDSENPLESHILLLNDNRNGSSDENKEPQVAKLSVREISSMKISNAYLAFLGACHTANNPVIELADEPLHLVSSFQLAGFKNVIGNMWKADDGCCQTFSETFYRHFLPCSGNNGVEVADAYHHALKRLRDQDPDDFIGWIPFVHFGA